MNPLRSLSRKLELLQLSRLARAVLKNKLTYLSPQKLRRIEETLRGVKLVPGDVVEFGVALGGSGILLAKSSDGQKRFLGFDVFAMIPPPASEKDDNKSKERYARIKAGESKGIGGAQYYGYRTDLFQEVTAAFATYGVPVDGKSVLLYKGLFQDTLPTVAIENIAVAHIDCDWYDPVKYCLNFCSSRVPLGGAIIIDDYHDYGGCRTAVDEFLAEHLDFRFESGPNPILRRIAPNGSK